jgi:hypothetical protein
LRLRSTLPHILAIPVLAVPAQTMAQQKPLAVADGQMHRQPNALATRATASTGVAGCVNILYYGADRTGSAPSDAAWTDALAAAQAGKQCVYLPAGDYKFSTERSLSISRGYAQGSVTIKGDGAELTRLNFASNTNGISITLNGAFQSFHVQDLTIMAGGWSTSTHGLYVTQAAIVSNPAYSGASDITRVVVRGNDGYAQTNGFNYAVTLDAVSNVNVIGGYLSGPGRYPLQSVCVNLVGRTNTNAVVFNIVGSTINSCNIGVLYGSSVEGVSVASSNFVGDNIGIYVPPGSTDAAQLAVTNSHFNDYVAAIDLEVDPGDVSIVGNFIIANTQVGSASGIVIGATQAFTIVGNSFAKQGSGLATGIVINEYGRKSGIIQSNVFDGFTTGISLKPASQRVTVGTNSYSRSVSTTVINDGTNNVVATTCTAAPTPSFRVTNGIVTAC